METSLLRHMTTTLLRHMTLAFAGIMAYYGGRMFWSLMTGQQIVVELRLFIALMSFSTSLLLVKDWRPAGGDSR